MEIDAAVSMAGYAAFALQQPLTLEHLAAAAERAELPMASAAAADAEFATVPGTTPSESATASPQRAEHLLANAPEITARGDDDTPHPFRRVTDPDPLD